MAPKLTRAAVPKLSGKISARSTLTPEIPSDEPRFLTPDEIADIVNVIEPPPATCEQVAEANYRQIKAKFALHLAEIQLRPSKLLTLKDFFFRTCRLAMVQPGFPAGLQAAESVSQPLTQSYLDAFHKSGAANTGTTGLQGFTELLDLTSFRKVPTTNIHFQNYNLTFAEINQIKRAFVCVSIKNLLKDNVTGKVYRRHFAGEKLPGFYASWLSYAKSMRANAEFPAFFSAGGKGMPYLRLIFDTYKLFQTRITMGEIASSMMRGGGVLCIFSSTAEGILDLYANVGDTAEACILSAENINSKTMTFYDTTGLPFSFEEGSAAGVVKKTLEKGVAAQLSREARPFRSLETKGGGGKVAIAPAYKEVDLVGMQLADQLREKRRAAFTAARMADVNQSELPEENRTIPRVSRNPLVRGGASTLSAFQTQEATPVVFLQRCLEPRINDETILVYSSVSRELLERAAGDKFIPPQAQATNRFRVGEIVTQATLSICRGATLVREFSVDSLSSASNEATLSSLINAGSSYNFWIDFPKQHSSGIPLSKLTELILEVFPDVQISEIDTNGALRVTFPTSQTANPFSVIEKAVSSAVNEYKDAMRAIYSAFAGSSRAELAFRLSELPTPKLVKLGTYYYVQGMMNLTPAMSILLCHPAINPVYTLSNSFKEVEELRGIEIVHAMIVRNLFDLCVSGGGSIHPRHIQLFGSTMTFTGRLMAFTARSSASLQEMGAFSESAFEQALPAFKRSAIRGTLEPVSVTSASVVTGNLIAPGTGSMMVVATGIEPGADPPYIAAAEKAYRLRAEEYERMVEEKRRGVVEAELAEQIKGEKAVQFAETEFIMADPPIIDSRFEPVEGDLQSEMEIRAAGTEIREIQPTSFGTMKWPPDEADFGLGVDNLEYYLGKIGMVLE